MEKDNVNTKAEQEATDEDEDNKSNIKVDTKTQGKQRTKGKGKGNGKVKSDKTKDETVGRKVAKTTAEGAIKESEQPKAKKEAKDEQVENLTTESLVDTESANVADVEEAEIESSTRKAGEGDEGSDI